jgi:amino-acid N-acetyltransferase
MFSLTRAAPTDLSAILALLREAQLLETGVEQVLGSTLVARASGKLMGCAAVERHAAHGLLRSVAVASDWQGRGVGRALVSESLGLAESAGVTSLYLLTTTAPAFFERFGFARCARTEAPAAIASSWEFQAGCPASATFMHRLAAHS